jgi:hypothetical protein
MLLNDLAPTTATLFYFAHLKNFEIKNKGEC